jgi:hypothetical protein
LNLKFRTEFEVFGGISQMFPFISDINRNKMNKPELLLPAGDFEKLKFAFQYGADAVYAGGTGIFASGEGKRF